MGSKARLIRVVSVVANSLLERAPSSRKTTTVADQPDPREIFRQCVITEDEFSVLLDYHRSIVMAQQFESVALRTYSTCFMMRAVHAVERLKALDPAAWQRVDEELERAMSGWIEQANAETEWEEQDDLLYSASPATDEEWASFVACVEDQQTAAGEEQPHE